MMANSRPRTEATVELDVSKSVSSAGSVASDFAALVTILERQLELVAISDQETRRHILQAKAAAERGVQLSRALVRRIEPQD